jgi:hypothetical protein
MKNVVDSSREGGKIHTNQLQAGFTRRDILALLWTAGGLSAYIGFLASLTDDRKFQTAELEVVKLSSTTQAWSLNPASRVDPAYHINPARKLQFGNKEKYTVSVQLPDGTVDAQEIPEELFKKLKKWDKIPCQYLIRYDGMQLLTKVLVGENS